jgi:hypothetical protein
LEGSVANVVECGAFPRRRTEVKNYRYSVKGGTGPAVKKSGGETPASVDWYKPSNKPRPSGDALVGGPALWRVPQ